MRMPKLIGECRRCGDLTDKLISTGEQEADFLCAKCGKLVRETEETIGRKRRRSGRGTDAKRNADEDKKAGIH